MTVFTTINVAGTPNPALGSTATQGSNSVAALKAGAVQTLYYVSSGAFGSTTSAASVPAGSSIYRKVTL